MKEPLKEPKAISDNKQIQRKQYRTALQSESEIDEVLFIQDDIKNLEKQDKIKPKNL